MASSFAAEVYVLGLVELRTGAADPTAGGGVAAPIGSLYLRTNGTVWIKTGAAAIAWSLISSGNAQAFSYVADGTEGSSFNVALPATRANANYLVFVNAGDMDAALAVTIPTTGRMATQFPVLTTSAVVVGDTFEFLVIDPT